MKIFIQPSCEVSHWFLVKQNNAAARARARTEAITSHHRDRLPARDKDQSTDSLCGAATTASWPFRNIPLTQKRVDDQRLPGMTGDYTAGAANQMKETEKLY